MSLAFKIWLAPFFFFEFLQNPKNPTILNSFVIFRWNVQEWSSPKNLHYNYTCLQAKAVPAIPLRVLGARGNIILYMVLQLAISKQNHSWQD